MIIGEKNQNFRRKLTIQQINNIGLKVALYHRIGTNEFIALHDFNGNPVYNVNEIVVEDVTKQPIWKQQMQWQMGKRPHDIVTRKTMRLKSLELNEIEHKQFEVYIAKYY